MSPSDSHPEQPAPREGLEGGGDSDEEMLEFLRRERDRARAEGHEFFGVINGGDGPLIVVTTADQTILPDDDS